MKASVLVRPTLLWLLLLYYGSAAADQRRLLRGRPRVRLCVVSKISLHITSDILSVGAVGNVVFFKF